VKRQPGGQHGERHAGQRVLVALEPGRLAVDLLRCRETRGPDELAGLGQGGRGVPLREAEIGQVRVVGPSRARVDEDVGGLDVPVHDARPVRRVQCRRDGRQQGHRPLRCQLPLPLDNRVQVPAGDEPHRQVKDAVLLAGRVDGDDVRVIDEGRGPRLADEPLAKPLVGGGLRHQYLQGHVAAERLVPGAVDRRHPAGPELAFHPVAADQRSRRDPGKLPPRSRWREIHGHRSSCQANQRDLSSLSQHRPAAGFICTNVNNERIMAPEAGTGTMIRSG
jgi:hypothetical protein